VGLQPDVPVTLTQDDIANKRDTQLFAAIDSLRSDLTQATP